MFDKGIYEDTLNNLRMMEREYNLKNYNQIAPQINCDIIEELIKRHLELVENHDKYKKALDILKEQHDYLASNMHYNYPFSIEMLEKVQYCFEKLITEHFELVEEYKDTRKELDCYYEMMSNPQPYKFEDLKEGMWVWDNEKKEVIYIDFIKRNRIYFYTCKYDDGLFHRKFQDNRFFPVQMANVGCE